MRSFVALVASCVILAGCAGGGKGGGPATDYATSCMFEVDPPGAYVWNDGDTEVSPGGNGTAEGAAAMNACIQRKIAASGQSALPDVAGVSQSVTMKTEGARMTETYTYGNPPPQAASVGGKPKSAADSAPSPGKGTARQTSAQFGLCVPGLGVLQGGTSYCPTR